MTTDPAMNGGGHRPSGGAPVPITGATGRPGDLGEVTLAAGPELPSAARAAVSRWLDGRVSSGVVDDAQLLVSELATNSFLHAGEAAGAPVRLRAGREAAAVWFEVGDAGPDGAVVRRAPGSDREGGFGLHLVDALASEWGVTHVGGTQVWFSLQLRPVHL
jgi:anti-sigma regulatory factor (Ser/Thr protein kinase)